MMRSRLRKAGAWVTRAATSVGNVVAKLLGPGELMLVGGLVMVAVALWPGIGQLTLLPIGLVFIWIGMPTRYAFVLRPQVKERKPRRAT